MLQLAAGGVGLLGCLCSIAGPCGCCAADAGERPMMMSRVPAAQLKGVVWSPRSCAAACSCAAWCLVVTDTSSGRWPAYWQYAGPGSKCPVV